MTMNSMRSFWKGEIPLGRAFWLYGVVGFLVVCAATNLLTPQTLHPAGLVVGLGGGGLIYVLVFAILALAPQIGYQVFASVSIWRSAEQYRGSALQPFLCRLVLSLALAWTVSEVITIVVAFTPALRQYFIMSGSGGIFTPR